MSRHSNGLVRDQTDYGDHRREERTGYCGLCGHPWDWHDNVWLKVDDEGNTVEAKVRCRGGYPAGLTVVSCTCRHPYPQPTCPSCKRARHDKTKPKCYLC